MIFDMFWHRTIFTELTGQQHSHLLEVCNLITNHPSRVWVNCVSQSVHDTSVAKNLNTCILPSLPSRPSRPFIPSFPSFPSFPFWHSELSKGMRSRHNERYIKIYYLLVHVCTIIRTARNLLGLRVTVWKNIIRGKYLTPEQHFGERYPVIYDEASFRMLNTCYLLNVIIDNWAWKHASIQIPQLPTTTTNT